MIHQKIDVTLMFYSYNHFCDLKYTFSLQKGLSAGISSYKRNDKKHIRPKHM